MMPEPVLQSCASISQPVRQATSQTSEAAHRLYMQVSIGEFLPEFFFPVFCSDTLGITSSFWGHCCQYSAETSVLCNLQVQSEHVDMYGVVTNTKYHEYMCAARAALGDSVGLSMEVLMECYGVMMATTSFNITFKRCVGICCAYRVPMPGPLPGAAATV
jgi:hypothetical protein